ncbi:hypothetical protein [Paenibacillus roseipurpureus]|uniref:FAD dependent oxidoreductase n=1 Tax=Paenibacillus roseopurpureus TaxID=2918901 RepID=A0AA96RLT0_9BACL|nr:hypothetical protein [Paenibacillus sp. MBLB1832]WNR45995.1 hypothetical protein MJB10_07840 [Paenibacillus sp. MBLB1832]
MNAMTKVDYYPLLVCGATFTGIGAAAAAGGKAIVVERSTSVGKEYIEAIHHGERLDQQLKTAFVANFADDLRNRNLLEGHGPLHLPGVHPVLCNTIQKLGLNVLFGTIILEVTPHQQGGYEVVLHNIGGHRTIRVDEILDTTSLRRSTPEDLYKPVRKWLNAYVHPSRSSGDIPVPYTESFTLRKGRFPSEFILSLELEPNCDWASARKAYNELWVNRPPEWHDWTIAAIADQFVYEIPKGLQQLGFRWSWLPSLGLLNPLAAIDEGVHWQMSKEENDYEQITVR